MARRVLRIDPTVAATGVKIAGTTVTSDTVTLGNRKYGWETISVWIDVSSATQTLDLEFEVSEDSTNGVDGTWAPMRRGTTASQTQAAATQITSSTGAFVSPKFEIPCSDRGYVRLKMNVGGSSSYDVDSLYLIFRSTAVSSV